MKKTQQPVIDELLLDVMEHAFVKWLVRRGIFAAFMANFNDSPTARKTFRGCLRDLIRFVYRSPHLGPEALVDAAFIFVSTPEGFRYWIKHSDAWRRFYEKI